MKWLLWSIPIFFWTGISNGTPRMSLPAGTPCATCHYNPTGGGARNEVGWGAMGHTGAFDFNLFESNYLVKNRLTAGFDTRVQWAHFGIPVQRPTDDGGSEIVTPDFKAIPMQFQVNAGYTIAPGITLSGGYNAGPNTYKGDACDPVYAGMSCFEAALQYQSSGGYSVRAGMIQPNIGIRPDDHTTLVRGDAVNPRRPVIPPNYAEWGGDVTYQPRSWFRTEFGLFHAANLDASLNEGIETAELAPIAYGGRITFLPRFEWGGQTDSDDNFDDDFDAAPPAKKTALHTWMGASFYGSGKFHMINGFTGAGLQNGLEMRFELAHAKRSTDYRSLNASLAATWAFVDWLVPAIRVEGARTQASTEFTTWQYVGGVEFFPVAGVEIRPEYRIVKTNGYIFGQPTVQLHVFF